MGCDFNGRNVNLVQQAVQQQSLMAELIEYFNRFYNIAIKQFITDPLVHSQWSYFLSMFKNTPLEKNRIDLYLDILGKEHNKKSELRSTEKGTSSIHSAENKSKTVENSEPQLPVSEIKFQKRLSENWRGTLVAFDKSNQENMKVRKLSSLEQGSSSSLLKFNTETGSKTLKARRQEITFGNTGNGSPNVNQYMTSLAFNLRPVEVKEVKEVKQDKDKSKMRQKHKKLCQISSRITKIFEGTSKLRA